MSEETPWAQSEASIPYQSPAAGPIMLSSQGLALLRKIRPWVMFLSVFFFCGTAFFGFIGVIALVMAILGLRGVAVGAGGDPPMAIEAIFYLIVTVVCLILAVMLLRVFLAIGKLIAFGTPERLDGVIGSQLAFVRVMGIMAITSFVLMIGGFVAAIVIAMASGGIR